MILVRQPGRAIITVALPACTKDSFEKSNTTLQFLADFLPHVFIIKLQEISVLQLVLHILPGCNEIHAAVLSLPGLFHCTIVP